MNPYHPSTFYIVAVIQFDPFGESYIVDSRNCNRRELRKVKKSFKSTYNDIDFRIVTHKQRVIISK